MLSWEIANFMAKKVKIVYKYYVGINIYASLLMSFIRYVKLAQYIIRGNCIVYTKKKLIYKKDQLYFKYLLVVGYKE